MAVARLASLLNPPQEERTGLTDVIRLGILMYIRAEGGTMGIALAV